MNESCETKTKQKEMRNEVNFDLHDVIEAKPV
jgi:hypothetical protein